MTKKIVADVRRNSIVRFKGEWGVIGMTSNGSNKKWLDRWYGGPLPLSRTDVVEVLTKGGR